MTMIHRKPGYVLVFLLLYGFTTQPVRADRPDEPITQRFDFSLRAKALGFVIIEDVWVRTFSIGFETRFDEKFSITADVVHFRWKYEYEMYPPPSPYVEYKKWDPRNYIAFEARYYPDFGFMPEDSRLYLTCFTKFGTRRIYCEELYTLTEGEVRSMNSDFHDVGPAIGIQCGNIWGLDVNIGAAYRQEVKSEEIFHANAPFTYTYNVWERRWIGNIRVNFFLNFSRL